VYFISIKRHFDAAHRLLNYPGKCANLHGHRWEVEVIVKGNGLNQLGMVTDFGSIKSTLDRYLESLDHSLLLSNRETEKFKDTSHIMFDPNPTAEVLSKEIYKFLKKEYIPVYEVRVFESPDCWAGYRE